jgi:hypothetical protein
MIKYKLEKKVPMPEFRARLSSSRYPFGEMEVGDSFYVPAADVSSKASLKSSASVAQKRFGGKVFRVADEKGGYRVFRLK